MRGSYSDGLVTQNPGFGSAVEKLRFFCKPIWWSNKTKEIRENTQFQTEFKSLLFENPMILGISNLSLNSEGGNCMTWSSIIVQIRYIKKFFLEEIIFLNRYY